MQLTLSIPSNSLRATLRAYGELGTVLHEAITTKDITEQHFDLSARLANARVLESRLIGVVETGNEKLERELSRARDRVELLDGKLRSLESQVAFSTLRMQLTTREFFIASAPQSLGDEISLAFTRSLNGMVRLGRALLVLSAAVVPAAIPLGLLLWLWVRWLNRRSKRRRIPVVASGASSN